MGRRRNSLPLEALPPAYRAQVERRLRGVAGCDTPPPPAAAAAPAAPVTPRAEPLQPGTPPIATPGVSQRSANGRSKQPNPTERKFQLEMLGGKGRFEAVTFRTAGGSYTPDWVVADEGGMTCYEVKGSYGYASENRAKFAFLATREAFPCVRFRWFRSMKGGVWKEEYRA